MVTLQRMAGLALIGMLVTACSSTTVKESWVKPGLSAKIENVYLIGIAKDEEFRRLFEEAFKRQLSDEDIRAIPSHIDLPKDQEDNRESIIQAMHANGCDSVLLTRLVRRKTGEGTRGPEIRLIEFSPIPLYNGWGDYYDQSYSVTNIQQTTPGTVTLMFESALFDLRTGERIWAAQLEMVKEIEVRKMIQDYVEAVTENLKGKGII